MVKNGAQIFIKNLRNGIERLQKQHSWNRHMWQNPITWVKHLPAVEGVLRIRCRGLWSYQRIIENACTLGTPFIEANQSKNTFKHLIHVFDKRHLFKTAIIHHLKRTITFLKKHSGCFTKARSEPERNEDLTIVPVSFHVCLVWHLTRTELSVHSQCVTNIEVSQAFSTWSNVGRLRFDQHLVKWLTFDQPMTIGDLDLD